jgi:hypothetical protein
VGSNWISIRLSLLLAIASPCAVSAEIRPVLFILDASGSMAEPFEGISRISAARGIMEEQLASMESSVPVGLVAYGNGLQGCDSSRLYIPMGRGNRRSLAGAIQAMRPDGNTPIATSLKFVRETILPVTTNATIVLISDGSESCGGDPAAEVGLIRARYPDVRLHIIGMTLNKGEITAFRNLAHDGMGKFFDVNNHSDFIKAVYLSVDPNYIEIEPPVLVRAADSPSHSPAAAAESHGLFLTDYRTAKKSGGGIALSVDYYFTIGERGDYFISLSGTGDPVVEKISNLRRANQGIVAGRAFYSEMEYRGTFTMDLPHQLAGRTIIIQGELWKINDIPKRERVSNTLTLTR